MIMDQSSDESSSTSFEHDPVMLDEIVDIFAVVPSGVVLDATLGGGGHARALLSSRSDIEILGLDRDEVALRAAGENLASFGNRVHLHRGRFDDLFSAMSRTGIDELSGALFDLGVSSHQFDVSERGFSYRFDGPLDMRMDRSQELTAGEIVNAAEVEELTRVLREYADERFAARIARAIVAARPVSSTRQLSEIVAAVIPAPARRRGGHPAKRTFQALRIAVNEELSILPRSIDDAIARVRHAGRVAVLSYHSGEDRIVKERFGHHCTGGCRCPRGLPCACGAVPTVRKVRVPGRPSDAEKLRNPRSRSARLRCVEVL